MERGEMARKCIAAIDQGTTSTRFMIFTHDGQEVGSYQLEHKQIYPEPGWVEHDPMEIWGRTQDVIEGSLATTPSSGRTPARTKSAMNWLRMVVRIASAPRSACPWRPTSPAPRSNGCWTT
jgi:glycerol kinase